MGILEGMMLNLPRLLHLDLAASIGRDVIDGERWERNVKDLVTFKFIFYTYIGNLQELDSFRTPFWLDEKRWFVAYMRGQFFSLPHSLTMEINNYAEFSRYTTAPTEEILYQNIDQLQLTRKSLDKLGLTRKSRYPYIRFMHVHTLAMHYPLHLHNIKAIVDLSQIRNLTIFSTRRNFRIRPMLNEMPNLRQITTIHELDIFYRQIQHHPLEQIETLQVGATLIRWRFNFNIEQFCTIFPNVKHLHINQECSPEQILDCLHRFKHLCTASFYCFGRYDHYDGYNDETRLYIESVLDDKQNTKGLEYTYRFSHTKVHFWIIPQSTYHRN